MLLQFLSLLISDPVAAILQILVFLAAIIAAVTIHEFSHALISHSLGDLTARRLGRLTLNPLAHLDPMGSVLFLIAGFGWGKPVPVNPRFFRRTEPRLGMSLVSLAGPMSNIMTASVAAFLVKFLINQIEQGILIPTRLLLIFMNISILLAVFNFAPIPPLDGFKVAVGLLPRRLAQHYSKLERFGPMPLFALLIAELAIPGINIFGTLIGKPTAIIMEAFLQ